MIPMMAIVINEFDDLAIHFTPPRPDFTSNSRNMSSIALCAIVMHILSPAAVTHATGNAYITTWEYYTTCSFCHMTISCNIGGSAYAKHNRYYAFPSLLWYSLYYTF